MYIYIYIYVGASILLLYYTFGTEGDSGVLSYGPLVNSGTPAFFL